MKKDILMDGTIWGVKGYTNIVDPKVLRERFSDILREVGFQVLNSTEHHFDPQGYTSLDLLAESHFAIHSFPEKGVTYFELSSCTEKRFNAFVELLRAEDSLYRLTVVDKVVPPNFDEQQIS